jgi:hypothetical protein
MVSTKPEGTSAKEKILLGTRGGGSACAAVEGTEKSTGARFLHMAH